MKTSKSKRSINIKIGIASVVIAVAILAAVCTPASARWYTYGLPLCDDFPHPDDPTAIDYNTVMENVTIENGSVAVPWESDYDIIPETYNYTFPVPWFDNLIYAGIYQDVWSNMGCGNMSFELNNHDLGTLHFGGHNPCGGGPDNTAGCGCGGNGVWWNNDFNPNFNSWVIPGQTNVYHKERINGSMDGRDRGAAFVLFYQDYNFTDRTVHIWFNQGMEDIMNEGASGEGETPVHIHNVTKDLADIWTLYACIDCGNGYDDFTFNGHEFDWHEEEHWMDVNKYDVTEWMNTTVNGTNIIEWDSGGADNYFHPYWTLLLGGPLDLRPDLTVKSMDTHVERDGQTPIAHVENHNYTIEATIQEIAGNEVNRSFDVALYDGANEVERKTIDYLNATKKVRVAFNWTNVQGVGQHTLKIVADVDGEITEVLENNNESSTVVDVLPEGTVPDLTPEIILLPTYDWHGQNHDNSTTICVNVSNVNTSDSGLYYADLYVDGDLEETKQMPSVNAMSWKHESFVFDATLGTTYDIEVGLRNVTNETNTGNNNATDTLKTITVRVKDTHHKGNTSDYSGPLSDGVTVQMFDVTKHVPANITLYNLISSVANVSTVKYESYKKVDTVDGLEESMAIYWYAFVNGIPVNDTVERNDLYQLQEGDVAHWDIMKYVNSGEVASEGCLGKPPETFFFKPRPIMDFPEPFLHGFWNVDTGVREIWDTTIVYPSVDASYSAYATDIRNRLIAEGVPAAKVNIKTNATLTTQEKENNHLILLGTPMKNDIIEALTTNTTFTIRIGVPVYFDRYFDPYHPDWFRWVDEDVNDTQVIKYPPEQHPYPEQNVQNASYQGVIMACDNPFRLIPPAVAPWDNVWGFDVDTWKDSCMTIWIVSGLTDSYAKQAAQRLATDQFGDKRFWNVTRVCGDVNGDCNQNVLDYYPLYRGGTYLSTTTIWAADVNCDGYVMWTDVYPCYRGGTWLQCCSGDC
ncbi:MAG: CARDB domain-containing protein [Halobacteriota archaeon]